MHCSRPQCWLVSCTLSKLGKKPHNPYAAWCSYIYLHNWVIYGANVGKYSSTMEHMGNMSIYPYYVRSCWRSGAGLGSEPNLSWTWSLFDQNWRPSGPQILFISSKKTSNLRSIEILTHTNIDAFLRPFPQRYSPSKPCFSIGSMSDLGAVFWGWYFIWWRGPLPYHHHILSTLYNIIYIYIHTYIYIYIHTYK